MQDVRALKNPTNLSSWRAWEGEAHRRSGSGAILTGVFALTLAFVLSLALLRGAMGEALLPMAFIGMALYFAVSLALIALAVLRVHAWRRANPWTPPS
ncbi:MAG: hypothetical protein ACK4YQ_16230 [Phenylobacterium sp.]|uniref:hypothetical protein n=1 Tax=Phenylobacterium sp. TaxID=1871053 RepID=UPI00391D99A7